MVKNRARKQETRNRMVSTGEPYSVARRSVTQPQPDQFGWTRFVVEYPNFTDKLNPDNGFPVGHEYSHHRNFEFQGSDSLEYGWYPTVGFFSDTNDVITKEIVVAVEGNDNIVAENNCYQPWVAFLLGLKQPLSFRTPAPAAFPNYITYGVSTLISGAWEGDLEPVAELGYAFWELQHLNNDRLYWVQSSYLINFIWEWFSERETITPELMTCWLNRKDETNFDINAIPSLTSAWRLMKQEDRNDFVDALTRYIPTIPDLYDIDDSDFIYNQYSHRRPVKAVTMHVGDKVKVKGIGKMLDVRAVSDNFVVLTHVSNTDENRYSIIDWTQGVIGTHNSYGYPVITDEDCANVLEALTNKSIEVSFRNRITLHVEKVRSF